MRHFQENTLASICLGFFSPPAQMSRARYTYAKQRWENHPFHYASLLHIEFIHVLQGPTRYIFLTQLFAKSQLQSAVCFSLSLFEDIIRKLSASTELKHSEPRSQTG